MWTTGLFSAGHFFLDPLHSISNRNNTENIIARVHSSFSKLTPPKKFMFWYAFHSSDKINVPGRINFDIRGRSVPWLRSGTRVMKHSLLSGSTPPNNHCSGTTLPLLCFRREITVSSICSIRPSPPISIGVSNKICVSQMRKPLNAIFAYSN